MFKVFVVFVSAVAYVVFGSVSGLKPTSEPVAPTDTPVSTAMPTPEVKLILTYLPIERLVGE